MRIDRPVLLLVLIAGLAAASILASCSEDPSSGDEAPEEQSPEDCTADEVFNTVLRRCFPREANNGDANSDAGANNTGEPDGASNNAADDIGEPDVPVEEDTTPDVPEEDVIDPGCDLDGDGAAAVGACGGDDCNDDDFFRTPGRPEVCDDRDNDCDGVVNEGITCTFFAHTGDTLYAVDPFNRRADPVGDVPDLQDIDTHPDGTLYGVTRSALFRFNAQRSTWQQVGDFPARIEDANGLAIDSAGGAYVTSGDTLYSVDLDSAQTSTIGVVGPDFYSSGDCVVNKLDTLYMTSKAEDQPDTLVVVNRVTGAGTNIGSVGYDRIFGLTAGWGTLYGLTFEGELLAIDPATGQGTLLHTFPEIRWFGAASTPSR